MGRLDPMPLAAAPRQPGVRRPVPAGRPLDATLRIPGSKSLTNRTLLVAALAGGTSTVTEVLRSDDTVVMVDALRALGLDVHVDWPARTAVARGSAGRVPAVEADVLCGEAATAARFLLAVCAAGSGTYRFDARPSLRRRPIGPLVDALTRLGARFEPERAERLPVTLHARGLRGGAHDVGGASSSQFLSGLLMAAPLAGAPLELRWTDPVSRPYVDLTCAVMEDFGVRVSRPGPDRYLVAAPSAYRPADVVVEADASTASYFFAAAAVTGGRVTVGNLDATTCRQGDVGFLRVLEEAGCTVSAGGSGTTVTGPERLRGLRADMSDIPDTFMTLAAIAPYAAGPVEITGVAHARVKESDRVSAVAANLRAVGVEVAERPDGLRIEPGRPRAGTVDSHGDHRIAMSFAVLSLRTPGIEIVGADSVEKTCPEFFDLWDRLLAR
jgi:3-phosphoshikimate 1-carboxyvinyltransferase